MPATLDLRRGQVVGDASRRAINLNTLTKAAAGTTYAPIASPVFTGDPKAPTPAPGDNDTSVATTAFVHTAVAAAGGITQLTGDATAGPGSGAQAVTLAAVNANVGTFQGLTVNAKGQVTAADNQNYAPLASPTFTGTPAAPTPAAGANTTQLATAAFVTASFIPATGVQITGTNTNNNAPAGYVGEYIVSNITTPLGLTTGTPANLTTVSLTAGDWDISGSIMLSGAGGAVISDRVGNVGTVSTGTGQSNFATDSWFRSRDTQSANANPSMVMTPLRLSLTTTTPVYLVAFAIFSPGTCTAIGILRARRVR